MSRGNRLILALLGLCLFSSLACSAAAASSGRQIVTISVNRRTAHPAAVPYGIITAYDRKVLALHPVLYLTLAHPSAGVYQDLSKGGGNGAYMPENKPPSPARLPNGALASQFNGHGQYVQVSSSSRLSLTHTGRLTVEAWIRPATLQFPLEEGHGYANILGKGEPDRYEYALRMYSARNREVPARPSRVSAYVFSRWGGWGSGAYFQDHVSIGGWLMVAFVVSDRPTPSWPNGYIEIYKNGQLRQRISLAQYHVRPTATSAPFRIATLSMSSFFDGAIGDVAVYDYPVPGSQIAITYDAMFTSTG